MARQKKCDEFYTRFEDIERELHHYKDHFKDKIIFCNCDDPEYSNFWRYFHLNFEHFGLKKLITTHYDASKSTYKMEYKGGDDNDCSAGITTPLETNGDFRSPECMELMEEADIVATNPPFSLFREYVQQLMEHHKKFLIIGSMNAITYQSIFFLIQKNKVWLGNGFKSGNAYFRVPSDIASAYARGVYDETTGLVKFRNCHWFTNLDIAKRHEKLTLWRQYSPDEYPKYDNYDAINVDRVADIPKDYDGVMGVPITFLDKYNPEQFEILGDSRYHDGKDVADDINILHGKKLYRRLLIRRLQ